MRWLIFILAFMGYGVALAGSAKTKTTAGKNYTSTLNHFLDRQNLEFAVPWQRELVFRFLEQVESMPFNKIAENPATMQKIGKAGMRLLTNKSLMDSISKSDGVNFPVVMSQLMTMFSDMEKMRTERDPKKAAKLRSKVIASLEKLGSDEKLILAIRNTLIANGDFLAKVLVEEGLITGTLGQKEFIAELLKYEEGRLLAEIIDIPIAVKKTEEAVARLLADKALMSKILHPKTAENVNTLATSIVSLSNELAADNKKPDADKINTKAMDVLRNVVNNGELISMILTTLGLDLTFSGSNTCPAPATKHSQVKDLLEHMVAGQ